MFWRKKNEGFEWQNYVRTTILLRRRDRHNKIEAAKQAAISSIKDAGRRGLDAGAAVTKSAGSSTWSSLKRLSAQPARAARAAYVFSAPRMSAAGVRLAIVAAPATRLINRPAVKTALIIAAICASAAAIARTVQFGFDGDAQFMAGLAGAAALALGLARSLTATVRDKATQRATVFHRAGETIAAMTRSVKLPVDRGPIALAGAAAFAAAMIWLALPSVSKFFSPLTPAPPTGAVETASLSGTATVLAGGVLRVSGSTVQIAGIEVPELNQTCLRDGKREWRCGQAAKSALERLAGGRRVACEPVATTDGGSTARCTVNGRDIGAELVRGGHAFAEAGLVSSEYGSEERTAKEAKAGLWAGYAERPAEWRARIWQEASRVAPGGCPIKGRVASGSRTYILPWAAGYSKATVREARGERWFCNEDEARTLGWSPQQRS